MNSQDPIASLPPLREVIKDAGLSARKSLGQNFLLDLNLTRRIARAAGPLANVVVLEIGPGPGGLTRALFLEGAAKVVTVERDERFRAALSAIEVRSQGRLTSLFFDALQVNYASLSAETKASRVVANLPYNIATPLIVLWLTQAPWPPWYDKLVIMLQQEVAERLVAHPGTSSYGRLAVIGQYRAKPKVLLKLPASVFTPPPKVASALVEIVPRPADTDDPPISVIEKVTAAAFGQRRKMLRSSLGSLGGDPIALLRSAGIDPAERAERLTVVDFVRLSRLLWNQQEQRSPRHSQ